MATPISKTIGELFAYTGGASCKPIYDQLDVISPGWTEDTVVDVLTYIEAMRLAGQQGNVNHGIYHALSVPQQRQFISWALDQLITYTPDAYARKAAMIQLKADLVDYVTAPTNPKKNALLATAKAIKPITTVEAEIFVANAFKGITNAVANNSVNGEVLRDFSRNVRMAGVRLTGLTPLQVEDAILTKLEQIIGVI